jgi:hypothetical protein
MTYRARFSLADSLGPQKTLNPECRSPSRRPVHHHVDSVSRGFALRQEHLEGLVKEIFHRKMDVSINVLL